MDPLSVDDRVTIPAEELDVRTMRAGGPGGQNVNKVETAVEIRFDVLTSSALGETARQRAVDALGARLVGEGGTLIVRSSVHRSQRRNLVEARERLAALLRESIRPRKTRRASRPTLGSKKRRLEKKRARGELKKGRRSDFREE